jgi:hypothetical protein
MFDGYASTGRSSRVMMSGLAFTLIVVIIARSPYTHANLSPEGYNRTDIIYVGEEHPFAGPGLTDPNGILTGDPVRDGRVLFFAYGCASCHGLNGEGSAVGKDLGKANSEEISQEVRRGPKTMPAFERRSVGHRPEKLIAFLESVRE